MAISKREFSEYIRDFKFLELFNYFGWDNDRAVNTVDVDGERFTLNSVAKKSGFRILICTADSNTKIPVYSIRSKVSQKAAQIFHDHIIIFIDGAKSEQVWLFISKIKGQPQKKTEIPYKVYQDAEKLYQRTAGLVFELDEEDNITIVDVMQRVRSNFSANSEKVTKKFYDSFKKNHKDLLGFIKGIDNQMSIDWYASLMLNRLMFCYFIQKRGFLDGNKNYLREKLAFSQKNKGKDKFYSFYRNFLLVLFHKGLGSYEHKDIEKEIGNIPYLNGGLFDIHEIEKQFTNIDISDEAFVRIFNFFDDWDWHLDSSANATGREINPDVLGYIFEKYINDRANMGAYYTQEDITEYISRNCIIPFVFDGIKKNYGYGFRKDGFVWSYLKESGDKYIFDTVKKGTDLALPEEIEIGVDTTKPGLLERRAAWNRPAAEDYALPTEIWREVVERRQRYFDIRSKIENGDITSINDFITYNLDIRQFLQDLTDNTEDELFVKVLFNTLSQITVLDPTCGSGAFLFAALNILEPIYESCLNRMETFVEEGSRSSAFLKVLEEVDNGNHPNRRYYIYKSIILNNLYGVDIMKEAVETAKLRLFLKLISTVNPEPYKENLGLEPLPDIDFNIKAGNSLVGIANEEELKDALMGSLDALAMRSEIFEECHSLSKALVRYKYIQLNGGENFAEFKESKENLNSRQKSLNEKLNKRLFEIYQVKNFNDWFKSHQPFHWYSECYEIMSDRGGFDIIIGNPPYVVYTENNKYKIINYRTLKCGNLYAFCYERATQLLNKKGKIGMILPNSSISAEKMSELQSLFRNNRTTWISNFSWRPSKLFEGADMLLAIVISSIPQISDTRVFSTKYNKWYREYREVLFNNLCFYDCSELIHIFNSIPKISSKLYFTIFNKMKDASNNKKFINSTQPYGSVLYYFRAVQYWIKILMEKPISFENGKLTETGEMKPLYFESEEHAYIALCLLSSTTFLLNYTTWASCQVINSRDLMFNFNFNNLSAENKINLLALGRLLKDDYQKNSEIKIRNYSKKGRSFVMEKQHFHIKESKSIIDEIDKELSKYYGFNEEELDYILNYDIKYRMGNTADEEDQ